MFMGESFKKAQKASSHRPLERMSPVSADLYDCSAVVGRVDTGHCGRRGVETSHARAKTEQLAYIFSNQ